MKLRILGALFAVTLVLGACSDSDDDASDTSSSDQQDSTQSDNVDDAPAGSGGDFVSSGDTSLGVVLVDADGLTLYAFTEDSSESPTCGGACADAWPPVQVDSAELPDGLDSTVFTVFDRGDGTFQLQAGDWPLYTFAADSSAGDVNGQGSGGVWFAVAPDGSLIET
jgi:predicted lipoprotein with Yx(FWY)xxD motif